MFDQEATGLASGLLIEARVMERKRRVLGHAHRPTRGGKSFLVLPLDGEEFVKVSIADWKIVPHTQVDPSQQKKLIVRRRDLWHHGIAITFGTMVRRYDQSGCAVVVSHTKNGAALEVLTSPLEETLEEWDTGLTEVVSYFQLGIAGATWLSQLHALPPNERAALIRHARERSNRN